MWKTWVFCAECNDPRRQEQQAPKGFLLPSSLFASLQYLPCSLNKNQIFQNDLWIGRHYFNHSCKYLHINTSNALLLREVCCNRKMNEASSPVSFDLTEYSFLSRDGKCLTFMCTSKKSHIKSTSSEWRWSRRSVKLTSTCVFFAYQVNVSNVCLPQISCQYTGNGTSNRSTKGLNLWAICFYHRYWSFFTWCGNNELIV